MQPRGKIIAGIITALAIVTLGCQSLLDIELPSFGQTPTSDLSEPQSMFVPPNKRVQILEGKTLHVETYHISTDQLTDIQILVNGQPLVSQAADAPDTFTAGQKENLIDIKVQGEQGDVIETAQVKPALPTAKKAVSLQIVGNVPGTYDLSLVATDEAGQQSTIDPPLRIEVFAE